MDIDLSKLTPAQVYARLIQTVVPRPVAWVLSLNENGTHNLAPFSYFNAVCSEPPLVMLSIGRKPDGTPKDTRVNIEERGNFVIHIAHRQLAEAVTASSATLPAGESELDRLGLTTVPFEGFPLPRLAACRVAFACECYDVRDIGPKPQSLILGEVRRIHIDDALTSVDAEGRVKVHASRLDPIGRLGGDEFVTFGNIISVPRPE